MAQTRKTEDCLDALSRLRENLPAPAARAELGRYLGHKSNQVVAKAAKLAALFELHEMRSQLVQAFHRFMENPAATDRGCAAKTEIVRALEAVGAREEAVFLTGIRHVQMEGSFGPPIDTAAGLRAAGAMGLIHMNYPDAIEEILPLLVDREADARIGAVRALARSTQPGVVPLLRLKVLQSDQSAEVITECFSALLRLAPRQSLSFVAAYLDPQDEVRSEAAAMALGESRQAEAVEMLKSRWRPDAGEAFGRALLLGLALARTESALEFLYSLVAGGNLRAAAGAIRALAMYRTDPKIRERLEALVTDANREALRQAFAAEFARRDT